MAGDNSNRVSAISTLLVERFERFGKSLLITSIKSSDNQRRRYHSKNSLSVDWQRVFLESELAVVKSKSELQPQYLVLKPNIYFCNGSYYGGFWNYLGMCGNGKYNLFYDVAYKGVFYDGKFNGNGCLYFPNGSKMDGIWNCGHMTAHRYIFPDSMYYGPYCEMPDRRFYNEIMSGLKPAGRSYLTNERPSRVIPPNCYDTGDGFYNPKTKCVVDPHNHKKIIRIPTKKEHNWIVKHCRKAWDEPAGYRPDLYENWECETDDDALSEKSDPTLRSVYHLSLAYNPTSDRDIDNKLQFTI